ncbi:MAG: TIGR01777 family protein [Bacteroidetes bacterium]|nr:MAG: TIGR01777 family protein [Bacteroidota bacterium]
MNILITGGTGFIGSRLVEAFAGQQHQVTVLTRRKRSSRNPYISYREWNGQEMPPAIGLYEAVINLAGASIAEGRWTSERKQLIIDSRRHATAACVQYINSSPRPPEVFISASGIGYYGADSEEVLDESAPAGEDFPARVCQIWEEEAQKAECRKLILRLGVVLGRGGGALEKMLPLYKWCLGARLGSGKQGFPWVHLADVEGVVRFGLENNKLQGPVNVVAPGLVDQATFSDILATVVGRPDLLVAPAFALRLMLGEQALLLLGGQKAVPASLQQAGYAFQFPELQAALEDIVG